MADIVRNWGYMGPGGSNRRYHTTVGQLMNGFPVGILQLWAHLPFFPGNVSNAWTYDFPVKFLYKYQSKNQRTYFSYWECPPYKIDITKTCKHPSRRKQYHKLTAGRGDK